MAQARFRYLSQEEVVAAGGTDMAAVIDVIERAFRVKAEGAVFMPPKVMITWSDEPATEAACILGAGVLAHTQLAALIAVLPALREVRVFDPDGGRAERFAARAN